MPLTKFKRTIAAHDWWISRFLLNLYYERREKRLSLKNGLPLRNKKEEDNYHNRWKDVLQFKCPFAFGLYSNYVKEDKTAIMSQPAATIVNDHLNSKRYSAFCSDKNNFDRLLPNAPFPTTLLRKNGWCVL